MNDIWLWLANSTQKLINNCRPFSDGEMMYHLHIIYVNYRLFMIFPFKQ